MLVLLQVLFQVGVEELVGLHAAHVVNFLVSAARACRWLRRQVVSLGTAVLDCIEDSRTVLGAHIAVGYGAVAPLVGLPLVMGYCHGRVPLVGSLVMVLLSGIQTLGRLTKLVLCDGCLRAVPKSRIQKLECRLNGYRKPSILSFDRKKLNPVEEQRNTRQKRKFHPIPPTFMTHYFASLVTKVIGVLNLLSLLLLTLTEGCLVGTFHVLRKEM